MAKPAKFTVTHPDATVSTRSSVRATYTHAVVLGSPRGVKIAAAESSLVAFRSDLERLQEALETGAVTEERRPWSFGGEYVTHYVGGEYATGYPEERGLKTDDEVRALLAEQIDAKRAFLPRIEAGLTEALAAPEVTYSVLRWSSSAANAAKGLREFRSYAASGHSLTVVEVD